MNITKIHIITGTPFPTTNSEKSCAYLDVLLRYLSKKGFSISVSVGINPDDTVRECLKANVFVITGVSRFGLIISHLLKDMGRTVMQTLPNNKMYLLE